MDFRDAGSGDSSRTWVPGAHDMLSRFSQPVGVLAGVGTGDMCTVGAAGIDGHPWLIDVTYSSAGGAPLARVRTIRNEQPSAHHRAVMPVNDAFVEFWAAAKAPRGQVRHEAIAALAGHLRTTQTSRTELVVDEVARPAEQMETEGYVAITTRNELCQMIVLAEATLASQLTLATVTVDRRG